jgi:acetyltransferase
MRRDKSNLINFFNPKSVAVVGASAEKGKVGNDLILNLKNNFPGKIYPVNLKKKEIEGFKSYPSILVIPDNVDLAIISIPAKFVPSVLEECGKKNCKNVVIISAGFKEIGQDGKELELKLKAIAKQYEIRVLGPNCLGYLSTILPINASFAGDWPITGNVAFASQSGALGTAILDKAQAQQLGFAYFVSLGNKVDINEIDLLNFFATDEKIKVILMYLEEIENGTEFLKVASKVSKKKPIIVLKAGKTEAGQKAVSSHTGSLAGSARAYSAAFAQAGVIETDGIDDFFNLAEGFSYQPLPKGNKIGIVTNAGGPGILLTDLLSSSSLNLADLSEKTKSYLKQNLPAAASVHNPVDILGDAKPDRYVLAVEAVLKDPSVDTLIVLLTPQKMTEVEETAKAIGLINQKSDKPIFLCFLGEASIDKFYPTFHDNNLPQYDAPIEVVKVISQMHRYYLWQTQKELAGPKVASMKNQASLQLVNNTELTEKEIREILIPQKFSFNKAKFITDDKEGIAYANKIGYPVVLKVVSVDVIHKSDVGGVQVNIKTDQELSQAFADMKQKINSKLPAAKIKGFLVGEMVKGFEIILGMRQDNKFGPMVMVGAGGVYTEILKDTAVRIAPITQIEALAMIKELKIYDLLAGSRGQKEYDILALADLIVKLANFSLSYPEIKEIDLNPVMLQEKGEGYLIVDARFLK